MRVFIDTSALYAALDTRDAAHSAARGEWTAVLSGDDDLLTSNYVLLETNALVERRLGIDAVRVFEAEFVPALEVVWVDAPRHRRAVAGLLSAGKRDLSLVDCVSFELMRDLGVATAFAFDEHFRQQGFDSLPHARPEPVTGEEPGSF